MIHTIQVENIKCGGCMNTIKNAISKIEGVSAVNIDDDKETVTIDGSSDRQALVDKLAHLGYPETGSNNLAHKPSHL